MSANSAKRRRSKTCGTTSTTKRAAGCQSATQPTRRMPWDRPSTTTLLLDSLMAVETITRIRRTAIPMLAAPFSWRTGDRSDVAGRRPCGGSSGSRLEPHLRRCSRGPTPGRRSSGAKAPRFGGVPTRRRGSSAHLRRASARRRAARRTPRRAGRWTTGESRTRVSTAALRGSRRPFGTPGSLTLSALCGSENSLLDSRRDPRRGRLGSTTKAKEVGLARAANT